MSEKQIAQSAAPEESVLGRRRLLQVASGAFVLSTSGHYLPTAGEDAEARTGVLGGRLGGRRGPDRRGRKRRRTHGDKKDRRDSAPPRSGPDGASFGVRVYVLNYRSTAIEVQGWVAPFNDVRTWSQPDGNWRWSTVGALPTSGDPQYTVFRTDLANLAVQIGMDRVVYVEGSNTPDPRWTAVLAGLWDATGWDTEPQTLKLKDLKPSESLTVEGLRLQRLDNTHPLATNPEYEFYLYVI